MAKFETTTNYTPADFNYHLDLAFCKKRTTFTQDEGSLIAELDAEFKEAVRVSCKQAKAAGYKTIRQDLKEYFDAHGGRDYTDLTSGREKHFLPREDDRPKEANYDTLIRVVIPQSFVVYLAGQPHLNILGKLAQAHKNNVEAVKSGAYVRSGMMDGALKSEAFINGLQAYWAERSQVQRTYYAWDIFKVGFSRAKKHEAVEALITVLTCEKKERNELPIDLNRHLEALRNGNLGKSLRNLIKQGHADDIVGRRCHTVRDFVAALVENEKKIADHAAVDMSVPMSLTM